MTPNAGRALDRWTSPAPHCLARTRGVQSLISSSLRVGGESRGHETAPPRRQRWTGPARSRRVTRSLGGARSAFWTEPAPEDPDSPSYPPDEMSSGWCGEIRLRGRRKRRVLCGRPCPKDRGRIAPMIIDEHERTPPSGTPDQVGLDTLTDSEPGPRTQPPGTGTSIQTTGGRSSGTGSRRPGGTAGRGRSARTPRRRRSSAAVDGST